MALRKQPARFREVVQYELNKITLNNFRSISDQEITIKPLTIVVGGNSAGKSSLLKAVLLMAQAQREKNIPGEVALNGSWVRLEQFQSVVQGGDLDKEISIGLNFALSREVHLVTRDLVFSPDFSFMADLEGELNYEIQIGPTDRNRGVAIINHCVLETSSGLVDIKRTVANDQVGANTSGALPFHGDFEFSGRDDIDRADISGAILSGAIVTQCAIERPMIEVLIEEILKRMGRVAPSQALRRDPRMGDVETDNVIFDPDDYLNELHQLESHGSESILMNWDSDTAAGQIAYRLLGQRLESFKANVIMLQDVGISVVANDMARSIVSAALYIFRSILENEQRFPRISSLLNQVENDLSNKRSTNPGRSLHRHLRNASFYLKNSMELLIDHFIEEDEIWGSKVSYISEDSIVVGAIELDEYLSRSVHFLGPLRVAPTSAADYSRRGSDRGVGPEGQHLAYQLMMNPRVSGFQWKNPSKDRGDLSVNSEEMSFTSAMSYWVKELRLADSVRAEEIPGVGDSIKLVVPGVKSELSPNDVGVGVSQALPVIGAVLLANPGDLVVLEQPELHLHPDAQLELAEFFVAAMKSGRRLLIESHSEHFLNKLRLMAAKADEKVANELTEKVGFVFAERGIEDGLSQFRQVKLTSDGSIQDWPKGFFDQGTNAAKDLFLLRQKRLKS
jgi:predicted ATPase